MKKILVLAAILAPGLFFVSCGSDDDGGTTPSEPVDTSGTAENLLVVVDGGQNPIAWPGLDALGIGALVHAANAWASANSVNVNLPEYDLGNFGDYGVGGGSVSVTGTLTTTGWGAGAPPGQSFPGVTYSENSTSWTFNEQMVEE